jgi:hypothetical protein
VVKSNAKQRRGVWGFLAALALAGVLPLAHAGKVEGEPAAPPAAKVLDTEIRTDDAEEMRYWILLKLSDQYAAERGIEVRQDEIDAYIQGTERLAERDRLEREARLEAIEGRLGSVHLGDAERKALASERESLNQLQSDLREMSAGDQEEVRQARQAVASAFVRQWKLNQALYREYGGRIVYQQGGPEPLDAYRKFLEAQREQGAFEILNKNLDERFWRYYTNDAIHSFYPTGSEEERQAFAEPWWKSE